MVGLSGSPDMTRIRTFRVMLIGELLRAIAILSELRSLAEISIVFAHPMRDR